MREMFVRAFVAVCAGMCGGAAWGQAASPSSAPEARIRPEAIRDDQRDLTFTLTPRFQWQTRTDMDTTGRATVYRAGGDVVVGIRLTEELRLNLNNTGEASWYRFSGATGLIPGTGDPLRHAYRADFGPSLFWRLDQDWSVFFGGSVEFTAEEDIFRSNAVRWGGLAGARYRFSDDFALSFGINVSTRLEASLQYIPIVGVEWKISDRLRFDTRGPGGALTYTLTDEWSLALKGEYQRREFRLAQNRALLANGVLRDTVVPVTLELAWKPAAWARLAIEGGAVVYQTYSVRDNNGVKIGDERSDATGYLGVSASIRF